MGNQGQFDGLSIDLHSGKFAGTFDLPEESLLDQEVYFVVRTRVTGAQMTETRGGDLKRTNVFSVTGVTTLEPDVGYKLQTFQEAQLSFTTDLLDGRVQAEEDE